MDMRRYNPAISYKLREIPIKQITVWKEAQARTLARKGITELVKSIKSEGLQNPPMLQKDGKNRYLLMSGQRRLAAMKRLGAKKIPALVLTKKSSYDLDDAKAASVIENIHRKNMDVKETAIACQILMKQMGKTKAAKSLGMSMPTFKRYIGFAGVPEKIKSLVPKHLTRDEATKLYMMFSDVKKIQVVIKRMSKLEPKLRKKYLKALSLNPRSTHLTLLKKAKSMRVEQNISFKLKKTKARGLFSHARRHEMESSEFANKIVFEWLKRRGY